MADLARMELAAWQNFYVIVGSSGGALALLLIGIRNAWDTVTYMVIADSRRESPKRE